MPKILISGREAKPEERTRSAIAMQKLGTAAGYEVKIGYAQFQDDPKTYKTGAKAGIVFDGKVIDMVYAQGFKEGTLFTVTWLDNKLDTVLVNGKISTIADLKEKLKNA